MPTTRRSQVNLISLTSLVALATCGIPAITIAHPQPTNPPFVISRLLPKKTAYDCGSVGAITLTREANNHDRFTYDAVNTKGQTLTLKNGVGYGDPTSTIYTFVAKDGSEFIIEEFPTGKATLTTSGKGGANSTSFNCTVVKATRATSGESAVGSSSSATETRTTVIQTTTVSKPAPKPAPQPATGAVPALW